MDQIISYPIMASITDISIPDLNLKYIEMKFNKDTTYTVITNFKVACQNATTAQLYFNNRGAAPSSNKTEVSV